MSRYGSRTNLIKLLGLFIQVSENVGVIFRLLFSKLFEVFFWFCHFPEIYVLCDRTIEEDARRLKIGAPGT